MAEIKSKRSAPGWGKFIALGAGLAAIAIFFAIYIPSTQSHQTISGVKIEGVRIGVVPLAQLPAEISRATSELVARRVKFSADGEEFETPWQDVGVTVDGKALVQRLSMLGHTGNPVRDLAARWQAALGLLNIRAPFSIQRGQALDYFGTLKDRVDHAAEDARLDLEHHTVTSEKKGRILRVYETLAALEQSLFLRKNEVALSFSLIEPRVRAAELSQVNISTIMGQWETRYSASAVDSDRTYNLKVGADHLNGHILKPHEEFSFNEVVGDRTEKEGYRVAPVIQGGELIDGLAGGMCQIASTLHAAAFFAGLEIVSSTPHSRPSSYIPMGLDSTVVYPTTDLKLRNPYDFPVVMHYQVNQGSVKVELLGKERPNRVLFEREIKKETPFASETREDPEAPSGQRLVLQEGYPGYALIRRRYIFPKDVNVKWNGAKPTADLLHQQNIDAAQKQQWSLHYPATTQIIAIGTGPLTIPPKPAPPAHKIPPIAARDKPIFKMFK